MARIALLTPQFVTGDAASVDILGMRHVLAATGHEVEVFTSRRPCGNDGPRDLASVGRYLQSADSIAVLQYSVAWEPGQHALRDAPCRKVVRYSGAANHSDADAMCVSGDPLRELAQIGCDLYLSASRFDLLELIKRGAPEERSRVVPPFHQVERLHAVEGDRDVLAEFTDSRTNFLTVGRLRLTNGQLTPLEFFAHYHRQYDCESRLILINVDEAARSSHSPRIRERIAQLDLENDVILADNVSLPALKAYYLLAHALLIASEDDGYHSEIIEAMSLKLPVVALARAVVRETLADGGITWGEPDADLFAETLYQVTHDDSARLALGMSGWHRYCRHFTNRTIARQFQAAMSELL